MIGIMVFIVYRGYGLRSNYKYYKLFFGYVMKDTRKEISILATGEVFGWCATLRDIGYPCPLDKDGNRDCGNCYCG